MNLQERDKRIVEEYVAGQGTMTVIGERYGISRERVRQILGVFGVSVRYRDMRKRKRHNRVLSLAKTGSRTLEEISELSGLSYGYCCSVAANIRKPVSGGTVALGREGEDWFVEECEKRGLDAVPQLAHAPFDVLVNDYRVDVKYAASPLKSPSRRNVNPVWYFGIRKMDVDFYACIIATTKDVFIIPPDALPPSAGRDNSVFILTWPNTWNKSPKYAKYHEAWELLEK